VFSLKLIMLKEIPADLDGMLVTPD